MKKLSLVSATRKVHKLTGLRASLNFEHNQATTLQAKLQIGEALNFRRLIFLVERFYKKTRRNHRICLQSQWYIKPSNKSLKKICQLKPQNRMSQLLWSYPLTKLQPRLKR